MTSVDSEIAALVALLRTGTRPWQEYATLLEELGSARAIFEEEWGANRGQRSLFGDDPDGADPLGRAAADIARWNAQGMRILSVLDPDYPPNLRAVHDRPPMIFVAGRLVPQDARSVAVIGSRIASPSGRAQASAIAEHLVDGEFTVASGLAAGIDTAVHTAALARRGRTIAVIGTGLSRCYPPENASLQCRIATECGVVSQFWPEAPPTKRSFLARNAVMSGLALGTVVVEASRTSGARAQARLALKHGRPVLLLESLLEQQWAREQAERPGVHVVQSPAEIPALVERLASPGMLTA